MPEKAKELDSSDPGRESERELADVLTAISVVSKRLAKKLSRIAEQGEEVTEVGGHPDE